MIELQNMEEFKDLIQKGLVLVDFNATWCGPCRQLRPLLEEYSLENKNSKIVSVDVDKFPVLARNYGVMSIPNLKLIKDNNVIKEQIGFISKEELIEFIEK